MKIYLQASAASVLLCAVMVLFAFASDTVSVMEEPVSLPVVFESEQSYHGETPLLFPDKEFSSSEEAPFPSESEENSESSEEIVEPSEESPVSSAEPDSSNNISSAENSDVAGPYNTSEVDPSSVISSQVSSSLSSSSALPASSVISSSTPSSEPSSVPSSASSSASSTVSSSSSASFVPSSSVPSSSSSVSSSSGETVLAKINGSDQWVDVYDYLCQTVEAEMGGTFHTEALKAQAVAAYSYIRYENARGTAVSLPLRTPTQKTKDAVAAVLGEAIYYNGSIAFTPYHASSAGWTNPSSEVWSGSYSYLTRVESIYDPSSNNRNVTAIFSADRVQSGLEQLLGIDLDGSDPADWLNVVSVSASGYVLKVEVTDCNGTVHTITGRQVRESVLSYSIRSHAFTVSYADGAFTFVTNGYGHGVGMSQTGAQGYAQNGWSYKQILNHYYPGTSVR